MDSFSSFRIWSSVIKSVVRKTHLAIYCLTNIVNYFIFLKLHIIPILFNVLIIFFQPIV